MSTHALIGIEEGDGTYTASYVHDLPMRAGRKLTEHYSKRAKVRKLINLGALSILGRDIGGAHDFSHHDYTSDTCLAYRRDRGDTRDETRSTRSSSLSLLMQVAIGLDAEEVYLFTRTNTWVRVQTHITYTLDPLAE